VLISNLFATDIPQGPQTPGREHHLRRDAPGRTVTSFRPVCRRGQKAIRTITAQGLGPLLTASCYANSNDAVLNSNDPYLEVSEWTVLRGTPRTI
jgi:hypothetical protein